MKESICSKISDQLCDAEIKLWFHSHCYNRHRLYNITQHLIFHSTSASFNAHSKTLTYQIQTKKVYVLKLCIIYIICSLLNRNICKQPSHNYKWILCKKISSSLTFAPILPWNQVIDKFMIWTFYKDWLVHLFHCYSMTFSDLWVETRS